MYKTLLALSLLLAACDGADDTDPALDTDPATDTDVPTDTDLPAGVEIAGAWTDDFGGTHDISDAEWDMAFALFHVLEFDNGGDWLVAHNDAGNDFSPGLYSRFDWHDDGTDLWFCQTAFDAASEADARTTPAADPSDPATTGCGGFAWSMLTPR